jgi:ABC-2 type transport system permease protein
MKWTEQWVESNVQVVLHKLTRSFSIFLLFYFLLNNEWLFLIMLMGLNSTY